MLPLSLPGRVQPEPDELPEAWIVRLAEANHCTVRVLLRHIGVHQSDFSLRDWANTWLALERVSGIGLNDFPRDQDNALSRLYGAALIKHRSHSIRICPECFKTLYHLPSWTKTIYSYVCEKHALMLIGTCPTCRQELRYLFNQVGVFLRCHHCATPYSMMTSTPVPDAAARFQQMINRSATNLSLDHAAFFEITNSNAASALFFDELHRGHERRRPFEGRRRAERRFVALGTLVGGTEDIYAVSHLVFAYSTQTRKISLPTNNYFLRPYLEEVAEKIHDALHLHHGHRLGK
ncbi:TniQ family protein [Deinococcus marmoris]|uniref:TniQ family protein n=1 Tax=Deinococcus marmoris TaxID=249408 RepID=UPI00049843FA|nr:TniQ family protein [Deinococcus marmoris]